MEPINLIYWLQGYLEISGGKALSAKQVQVIQDHIDLVLKKETPNRNVDIGKIKLCAPTWQPNTIFPMGTGIDPQWAGGTGDYNPNSVVITTTNQPMTNLDLLLKDLPPASC